MVNANNLSFTYSHTCVRGHFNNKITLCTKTAQTYSQTCVTVFNIKTNFPF